MQKFCKWGPNLGYFKKRGGGVQLQAVSGGALEDNVKTIICGEIGIRVG